MFTLERNKKDIHRGEPPPRRAAKSKIKNATDATVGGWVACIVSKGVPAQKACKDDLVELILNTCRWVEIAVPVLDGSKFIYIACLYGYSGASGKNC